jgi:hypothetical protein
MLLHLSVRQGWLGMIGGQDCESIGPARGISLCLILFLIFAIFFFFFGGEGKLAINHQLEKGTSGAVALDSLPTGI